MSLTNPVADTSMPQVLPTPTRVITVDLNGNYEGSSTPTAPAFTTNIGGVKPTYVYAYGNEPYEPLTLHGVAQEFAINFASAAVPSGGVYDVAITFSEE